MAELKIRNIRSTDDAAIQGILNSGNMGTSVSVTQNLSSLSNFIKDFNLFIENDLGLTRVNDINQIDPDNIVFPSNNILTATQNNTTTVNLYSSYNYGYNIFAFNDDLQDTKPLFLKFNYNMIDVTATVSTSTFRKFAFSLYLEIISDGTVIHSANLNNGNVGSSISSTVTYSFYNSIGDSFGFYNKNALYCNILPYKAFKSGKSSTIDPTIQSYISFYIERNNEYVKFIRFCGIRETINTSADSLLNSLRSSMNFISYSGTTLSTSEYCFLPFSETNVKISNNEFPVFKTIDINPNTNFINENSNILMCYSDHIGSSNISLKNVTDSNGVVSKYIAHNNNNSVYYARNKYSTIMFKMD